MALARVQATAKVDATGTIAITMATPPTLGNALIVPVLGYNGVGHSASDSFGNSYLRAACREHGSSAGVTQFVCPRVIATGTPFTITVSTASSWSVASAIEVSGVGDGLTFDQLASATGTGTSAASGSTSALTADEVFVVGVHASQTGQASITVASVSPAWTQEYESLTTAFCPGEADSRVLTSATGTTPSISWTLASSASWAASVVAYRATTATTGLARVQATAKLSNSSANSHTLSFSTPPTVDNAVIVPVTAFTSSALPISVTDNQGHTFALAVAQVNAGNANIRVGIYYLPKLTGVAGAYTVTIAYRTGFSGYTLCCGLEVSGVGDGLAVAVTTSLGPSPTSTTPSTGSSPASAVGELFDVANVNSSNAQASITVESVSPAWTQEYEELSATNATGEAVSRLRTSQIGVTQSASWTLMTSSAWAGALAAFYATAAAGGPGGVAETVQAFVWGPV